MFETAFIFLVLIFLFFAFFWIAVISVLLYFLPVIIAYIRRHNNILAISVLTVALGWSCLGWIAAVLWALNSDISEEAIEQKEA